MSGNGQGVNLFIPPINPFRGVIIQFIIRVGIVKIAPNAALIAAIIMLIIIKRIIIITFAAKTKKLINTYKNSIEHPILQS